MEIILVVLSVVVGILAILQGWQMTQGWRERRNPNSIAHKLDIIITQLGRMEQRLGDIWDKVKGE
ncbi:MAG: hypothetical protein KKF98_16890 [Bacteroidetes bacterium]|nr:hypothetical protein [Bacteroidota bacterium]